MGAGLPPLLMGEGKVDEHGPGGSMQHSVAGRFQKAAALGVGLRHAREARRWAKRPG